MWKAFAPFVAAIGEGREPPASVSLHPCVDAAAIAQIATEGRVADGLEPRGDAAGLIVESVAPDRALVLHAEAVGGGDDFFIVMVTDRLIRLRASGAYEDACLQKFEPPLVDGGEAFPCCLASAVVRTILRGRQSPRLRSRRSHIIACRPPERIS
jgi:hypothetical protein